MVTVAGETEIVTESETEEGIKNDPRRDSLVSQTVTMRETGKGRGGEVGINFHLLDFSQLSMVTLNSTCRGRSIPPLETLPLGPQSKDRV